MTPKKISTVWSSKWTFILASIGAAAGLGNLWKFPYLTYENGGAAFLFAYIICLLVLAKPIIITEVAMAQKLKKDLLGSFDRAAGGIGRYFAWCTILLLICLAAYYASIIAWGWDYLVESPHLGWGEDAKSFFFEEILQISDSIDDWGGFSWPVILGLIATYIAVYLSIFKGVVSVGKVVKWTVPLPFLFLILLFINATTLEGSFEGFKFFLVPDWSQLGEAKLWRDAIVMSFFSTNVGLALTVTYAQFNTKDNDIIFSSWMIGVGDFLVSFVAGLAMFGTLGYMSQGQGVPIEEVVASGPSLAFVTIPTALAALPYAAGFFTVLFFLSILFLAIDSMFAIIEAIVSPFKTQFKKIRSMNQSTVIGLFCIVFFGLSLVFAGGNGLFRLDVIDHYLFSHLFYLTITAQVIIIGWFFPVEDLRQFINSVSKIQLGSWFNILIKFFAPAVFIFIYISSLRGEFSENYGGYSTEALVAWGVIPICLILLVAAFLARKRIER